MTERRTWTGSIGPRLRTFSLLAATALPLALLTTGIGSVGAANAQPAARQALSSPTVASNQTAQQAAGVALPGVATGTHTVTLPTGDQVSLTPATGTADRYSISVRHAARANPVSQIIVARTVTTRSGTKEIFAVPADVEPYVTSGAVDSGLFDIEYLLNHETNGQFTVDVQYTGTMTDAELAGRAAALPGSSLVKTLSGDTVEVAVRLADTSRFWAAIVGSATTRSAVGLSAKLPGGIANVWLDGHRVGRPATARPTAEPSYTVNELIHATSTATLCLQSSGVDFCILAPSLTAVAGPDADQSFAPSAVTCLDQACATAEATYHVPTGVYSSFTFAGEYFGNAVQSFQADDPEFTVGNNTTFSVDLNKATRIAVHAPDPTVSYGNGVVESSRSTPDGTEVTGLTFSGWDTDNYWAVPTQQVTMGGYFVKTTYSMGAPPITMSITKPRTEQLQVVYPSPTGGDWRFPAGRRTLAVVDAGQGSAADFASVDAKGKLVLISNSADTTLDCLVDTAKLQNALDAGAVGVLQDPSQPLVFGPGGSCEEPEAPLYTFPFGGNPVPIPLVDLTPESVQTLRGALAGGPVTMTLDDVGTSPYQYNLSFYQNGHVPTNEAQTVTRSDLAERDVRFHSLPQPDATNVDEYISFAYNETVAGGVDLILPPAPVTQTTYVGPISPEIIWQQLLTLDKPDFSQQILAADETSLFDRGGDNGVDDWNYQPSGPGYPVFPSKLLQAQPNSFASPAVCAACREGNDFVPWMYGTSPDQGMTGLDSASGALLGQVPSTVQLSENGQVISPTSNPFGVSEYTLPATAGRYQMVLTEGDSVSTWDFDSAQPTTNEVPVGTDCASILFGVSGPCQPMPLIFLHYDAGADINNSVPAPGAHQISITASHQDPNAPAVTSLNVWTSVDGGKTWVPASTVNHHGTYVATYLVPRASITDGAVSIKVQATDAGGNDTTQVLTDDIRLATR